MKAKRSSEDHKTDGSLIDSRKDQLDRLAEHFRDQFSWPAVRIGLLLVPASKSVGRYQFSNRNESYQGVLRFRIVGRTGPRT